MTGLAQEHEATLRNAIMRVKPGYFSWPTEEQEKFRAELSPDEEFRVEQIVLRSLFQIDVATQDELDAALKGFNDEQHTLWGRTLQPLRGIGEDFFSLNESLGNKKLCDFATLYDYDILGHKFQEDVRKSECPDYVPKPYRGSLYLSWARFFMDGRFYNATLSMAAGYLYSQIDDAGHGQMARLIPHNYVEGKRHLERTRAGAIWDMRIDAGGMEGQLEELMRRFWRYLEERYEQLQQEYDASTDRAVWIIDRSTPEENHVHVVFSDKAALQHVRLRHFVHDCRSLNINSTRLNEAVERERSAVQHFLNDTHTLISN